MGIRLYNTLTRRKEDFTPLDSGRVTMYVCGPTVYHYAHIGNARPPVVFDLLHRLLRRHYPAVDYARNITDVDDKIMAAAEREGCPIDEITARYARIYNEDMASLGVLPPAIEPHATGHIGEMIAMIETLIDGGFAYAAQGHVLFDVATYPGYGELSGRSLDEMIAGARVEVAPYKRNPADFVLWKPSSDDQPGWDSPWGRGRPGWHIECSAMSQHHLGDTIDIHGGGNDLKFPHHENERAQSECAHGGRAFARYWMHNGFLTIDEEKMSKSLGNIVSVHDLLDKVPGEVLRLVLMTAHYRQPLDWSEDAVHDARRRLDGLYRTLESLADIETAENTDCPRPIMEALEDDLNTPRALSELAAIDRDARAANDPAEQSRLKAELLAAGAQLGLLQSDPDAWFRGSDQGGLDEDEVERLIAARNAARDQRDFAEADRIRKELADQGIVLEDGPGGTTWRRS